MLQNKDITNLSELKTSFVQDNKKSEFFLKFVDVLKLGKLHLVFSKVKQKGIPSILIIRILLIFPFISQKNVHGYTKSAWHKFYDFGKDSFYRLKNNSKINWRSFHYGVIKLMIQTLNKQNDNTENSIIGVKALIFDDTLLSKTGKNIEGVSRIWDHVFHRTVLGFQLLVMGFYDGTMFIPINFSLHRSKGKNKKKPFGLKPKHYKSQYKKKRAANTAGYKRKKELDITKIKSAINMIKSCIKHNVVLAQYVLTDSWFTCWELVKTALDNNMHFIGMYSTPKTLFTYLNQELTYGKIRRLNTKNIKRNRRYNLYYIRTIVKWNGKKIVLYFTRKGKNGKWRTLLSTDLSLNFNQTIEIYQIRWTIEVFFKESKQLLGLGNSQSTNFDTQIADTTITMVQYIFLALQNRIERYQSIGQLFKGTKEDIVDLRLHHRLVQLLIAIIELVDGLFMQVNMDEIMTTIINDDKALSKIVRMINSFDKFHKQVA